MRFSQRDCAGRQEEEEQRIRRFRARNTDSTALISALDTTRRTSTDAFHELVAVAPLQLERKRVREESVGPTHPDELPHRMRGWIAIGHGVRDVQQFVGLACT